MALPKRRSPSEGDPSPKKRVRRPEAKASSASSNKQERPQSRKRRNPEGTKKKLKAAPKEALTAAKKNAKGGLMPSLSLEQMRKFYGEEEDFNIDDLNSTASLFLSKESRTPPSKEEMKRLAEDRRRMMREQKEALKEIMEKEAAEEEELRSKRFDFEEGK